MPELHAFLRAAWEATEREKAKAEDAAANALLDGRIAELREQIATKNRELAKGWKFVGKAVLALAGVTLLALFAQDMANSRTGGALQHGLGALGVLLLVLPFWGGIAFVALLIVWVLLTSIMHWVTVATLESQIRSSQAQRR